MPIINAFRKTNNNTRRNLQNGFSLIELIIVILVLGIISMIAIPNLLAARRASNEAAAIGNTRVIFSSQATYKASSPTRDFGTFFQLQASGYIDSTLGPAPSVKSGYYFEMEVFASTATNQAQMNLRTRPVAHTLLNPFYGTGSRDFGVSEAGAMFQTVDNTPVMFDATTRAAQGSAAPVGSN